MAKFEEVGVKAVVQGYDRFIFQITSMGKSITRLGVAGSGAAVGLGVATLAIGALAAGAAVAVGAVVGIGAALVSLGAGGVETARSFETSFAGILKTTNDLGTNLYDLTDAGEIVLQQFRDMAKEIPISFEELSAIGEIAGQLGISESALSGFTRTVANLGISTVLSTEEAAFGLARIANVYQVSADDMSNNAERMGSTIAWLGNNIEANEDEILIFSRNIAGSAAAVGIAQDQLFALAAGFTATGNIAEAGGSSVQRILIEMSKAVQAGGDSLEAWAEASGMTADEFEKQWSTEGGAARNFMGFMEQLHMQGEGAISTLDTLDVDTIRVIRTMLSAAGGYEKLVKAMEGANTAWDQNTALTREAEIRYGTFDSQMQIIENRFRDMSFMIGQELIPSFMPFLTDIIDPFIEGLELGMPGAIEIVGGSLRNNLIPALTDLADAFGLTDPEKVASAIEGFAERIGNTIDDISTFTGKISEFIELYRSGDLAGAFEALGIEEGDAQILEAVNIQMFGILEHVKGIVSEKENIGSVFESIGTGIKDYALGELIRFVWWLDGAVSLLDVVAGFIEFFLQGLPGFTGAVEGFASNIADAFTGKISFADIFKGGEVFSPEGAGTGTGEDPLQRFIDGYKTRIEEAQPELQEKTKSTFDNVFNGFTEDIKPTIDESMIETGEEINTSFTATIDEIEPQMKDRGKMLGTQIMLGVQGGIMAKLGEIEAAAVEAIEALMAAMEEAAQISSPSKRGAYMGSMIMEGLGAGIVDGVDNVKNDMVASMMSVMGAGLSTAGNVTTNNSSIDKSFNVGDISMVTNDKSPISVVDNLAMMAALRG